MSESHVLAHRWYDLFARYAEDLYPGRYTHAKCHELADMAVEVRALAKAKGSTVVAHNYQYPELQEVADFVGDSLGLAYKVRDAGATRVDFSSVHFMGATAKIITGDATRVYVQGDPLTHGCSLVRGTDHAWLERWKLRNPDGVLVTYVNSDAYTKAICDYVSTSRNTAAVIARASQEHPGSKILVLPDKFLGLVMKAQAVEQMGVNPDLVEVYTNPFGGYNACCYVHEKIGDDAPERALEEYDDAELMLHPECGCASSCLFKLNAGILPKGRVYYLSTEGMLQRAHASGASRFVIGTEKGMVYRLRKEAPGKEFHPISQDAECGFMKQNTMEKLLASLREDRYEIVFDDATDPRREIVDGNVIRINRDVASKAKVAIDRMLAIQ